MTEPNEPQHYLEQDVPTPPIMKWFRLYCFLLAFVHFLMMAGGVLAIVFRSDLSMPKEEAAIMGGIYSCMGFVLMIPFAAAPFLPRRPWAWVFGIVLIALTMTSICCLPMAIPILIHYVKQDVKRYYGYPPIQDPV